MKKMFLINFLLIYISVTKLIAQAEYEIINAINYDEFQVIKKYINKNGINGTYRLNKKTILMYASELNNPDIVKYLIKNKDISLNLQDKQGNTALMYAAKAGNPEIVNILLKAGANPKILNNNNESALILAGIERGKFGRPMHRRPRYITDPRYFDYDRVIKSLTKKMNWAD